MAWMLRLGTRKFLRTLGWNFVADGLRSLGFFLALDV